MKIPLAFQITEYDCGTTTLLNAFLFLFQRQEIPVEVLKTIYQYTLDAIGKNGIRGEMGTSRKAMKQLTKWITKYAEEHSLKIKCENLEKEKVTEEKIKNCLNHHGCVIARCYQKNEHYVLITKMDDHLAFLFDPYYVGEKEYDKDHQVEVDLTHPFTYNRVVQIERLFGESKEDFSLMEVEKREIILMNKTA